MTKEQFGKQKWGAGMAIVYYEPGTKIEADVISVDFEKEEIGIDILGDLIFLPCEKCEITKDFVPNLLS